MTIFATGAYLQPRQLANGRWAWIVTEFYNDMTQDGAPLETPDGYLGQDDYHDHAERWGTEMGIEAYKPCVAVYRFENGRLVITVQGNPSKAIDVVAEALEQDGLPVQGKSAIMKITAIREAEQTMLFTLDMTDLPIGQVFDSAGREFKSAPLSRDAVNAQLDRDVDFQRATVGVDPDVMKHWPDWATAIAIRIADESPYVEDKPTLIAVLAECFKAMSHVAHRLIGTGIIESDYIQDV
jgi:hypothetical protein